MGSSAALPPKPDADGEPRPPAAPRVAGPWQGRFEVISTHFTSEQRRFLGAELPGPQLESAVARRPDRWRHAATGTLVTIALPGLIIPVVALLGTPDDRRAGVGLICAAVIAAVYGLFFLIAAFGDSRHQRLDADARSLAEWSSSDAPGPNVDVYELASITLVETRRHGPALRLADRRRGRLLAPCGLLEGNQQLWDLVYNGLRHSAADGATVDPHTRRLLDLPARDRADDAGRR